MAIMNYLAPYTQGNNRSLQDLTWFLGFFPVALGVVESLESTFGTLPDVSSPLLLAFVVEWTFGFASRFLSRRFRRLWMNLWNGSSVRFPVLRRLFAGFFVVFLRVLSSFFSGFSKASSSFSPSVSRFFHCPCRSG
ncbi:hypothetical protein C2G38_2196289 [Gigaspora rosea]|uniref:Uncharacterized protein n=1 Tax=Gigaspora rosea TaxID=44941 RepID=A0A397UWK7_9GLOM|nr:hypothetical protein C2G38_2196289 [Gigaspora rosea]